MTVHKLTAGDGYAYLSRQVAAQDSVTEARGGLSAYYTATGEAPGRWMGRGLSELTGAPLGPRVTEAQMSALFGEGRHPERPQIERAQLATGGTQAESDRASRLGAPYRVYTDASEFRRRCAVAFREFNADRGVPPGTSIDDEDRARIRTALATEMFIDVFGRAPTDHRELSGHLARISRQRTTAVAGYDLTFSPAKSISTLWAIAPLDVADVIERAHADAVSDVIAWLEDHAVFSRTGHNGVAQVDVHGVIAAAFTHRDSRAGDPDLHTHVAISNKVRTLDGRWLALDGRAIYKNNVAASERYNTRIEALLVERLGVRFAERRDGDPGKRPVREIVGVGRALPRLWSSRRHAIDARRAELSAQFQSEHGRPPTAREAIHLAQQANLETRQDKHEPRSHAEQRATWRAEALSVLGSAEDLDRYVAGALAPDRRRAGRFVTPGWMEDAAREVADRVAVSRSTWDEAHLRAEAERRVRWAGVHATELDRAVDGIVERALSPPFSLRLTPARDEDEPAALRRRDGSSVFEVAGSAVHTSESILSAERAVIEAAGRFDGHVTPAAAVDAALQAAAATGPALNAGQTDFVRLLATSGARVQVALAPAGTGKTTALGALADAWRAGGGSIIGLAPSAAASSVLRQQLADSTDTVAKFVHAHRTGIDVPGWLATLGPTSLVVVDEAAAAPTQDLAQVVDAVLTAGGSVRLVGDDQQLGAIGAGGLLTDLAATHGAVQLGEVVRFVHADTGAPNAVEGTVSLALRDGDPAALAYYADHGRLHVGDLTSGLSQAYAAWAADRAAGRNPLMLAPTRELVRELNVRARTDRMAREGVPGLEVVLADGTRASAGDVVISRRNDRTLANGAEAWVVNGDRWTVAAVRPSGALDVVHTETASVVTLPADYVQAHLTLGYATTVHGAQGVTADSSYTVVAGNESRQLLYVALTRGRHTNHAFVTVTSDGDDHSAITRNGVLPPTAVEILERVLSRDHAQASASRVVVQESSPAHQLTAEVDRYVHAVTVAAEERVGTAGLDAIDRAAESALPGLTDEPAYPALRAELTLRGAAGHDPVRELGRAISRRELDTADDSAAVLHWRLPRRTTVKRSPLPWLPSVPSATHHDPVWGDYLAHRAERVQQASAAVADAATRWTPSSAPTWARPFLDDVELLAELAVWRSATATESADHRPTGPPCASVTGRIEQRNLDRRVRQHLGTSAADAVRWAARLRDGTPTITADPYWPVLLDRLVNSRLADPDGAALLEAATAKPLPDELPAAALWWRLLEHIPTRNDLTTSTGHAAARPDIDTPGTTDEVAEPQRTDFAEQDKTTRERVMELNSLAATFFAKAYAGSWAQDYLTERLGSDPACMTAHVVGLAPRPWTALVDHLRAAGATESEMVAAGLATVASNGRLIDRFRDRVVFAIRDHDGIVGWIGRRHPDTDRHPHPMTPKYLNTPETEAFTKGDHLYGLVDNRKALDDGATPVIVEGPLDALAVTIAGAGRFVGVAPLGTAFTAEQAGQLLPTIRPDRPGPIVAMDADQAGRRSAERIFWQLGPLMDTRSLVIPDGSDPAALARTDHGRALVAALNLNVGLADDLVDRRISAFLNRIDTVEGQVAATRHAAEVIAAVPVHRWPALLTQVVARTGIAPDIVLSEVLAAADSGVEGSDPPAERRPQGRRPGRSTDTRRNLHPAADAARLYGRTSIEHPPSQRR